MIVIIGWIAFIVLTSINYYRTQKALESYINSTVLENIQDRYNSNNNSKVNLINLNL